MAGIRSLSLRVFPMLSPEWSADPVRGVLSCQPAVVAACCATGEAAWQPPESQSAEVRKL